jgi:hypothetical protein
MKQENTKATPSRAAFWIKIVIINRQYHAKFFVRSLPARQTDFQLPFFFCPSLSEVNRRSQNFSKFNFRLPVGGFVKLADLLKRLAYAKRVCVAGNDYFCRGFIFGIINIIGI